MFGNRERDRDAPQDQTVQQPQTHSQPVAPARERRTDTVIGQGTHFNGTLRVDGSLTIHGEFEGAVTCTGHLVVGKTGKVTADLDVGSTLIGGKVEGSVRAKDRVELQTASLLKGDVHAKSFVIQDGCSFQGNCTMGNAAEFERSGGQDSKTGPEVGILKQA
jgi:cytoskeletal protein CcmA (bactofilin family)